MKWIVLQVCLKAKGKIRCKILAAGASDVHRLKEIRLKNALAKVDIVGDTLTINLKDVWGDISCARSFPITTQAPG
jgi:hypothetical protein